MLLSGIRNSPSKLTNLRPPILFKSFLEIIFITSKEWELFMLYLKALMIKLNKYKKDIIKSIACMNNKQSYNLKSMILLLNLKWRG